LLGERRLDDLSPKDRGVAFVSGSYVPYPRLTVRDNLAMGLGRRTFPKTEINKRILAVAEIMELQGLLERDAQSVSREERQRIAFARAMVLQPKVFLFDEPFANAGSRARERGRAEIEKLYQRLPATMIYATHDPIEAMAMGDRMVVIDRGVVQQDGSAQSLYDEPANLFVAGFVGNPAMNLVRGTLKQDRDSLFFSEEGDGTIELRLPTSRFTGARDFAGKTVVLGIRAEDIEISARTTGRERSPTIFRALVDRVEPRGPETDLHLQTGAHTLICRSRRAIDEGRGSYRAEFEVDVEKAQIFDIHSGRNITQGS
jgi:multiple sugar transport system ATP-binding protein